MAESVGSSMALEQVRALLKKDANGASLHQQLCSIIGKLVEEKPPDALATLETMSRYLKESGFSGARAPDTAESIVLDPKTEAAKETWCSSVIKLTETPMESIGTVKSLCSVENFLDSATMFKWAGVGFGQQVSYQMHLSLRALAASTPGLSKLRFWGKILGINNDYFIAEGVIEGVGETDGEKELGLQAAYVEARGNGVNTFCYWVSTGTNASWVQLPLARPEHIIAARKVKHLMTGDLEADVLTMPFFPGKEKHFLRAQIARISSSTCLAPKEYLKEEAEGEPGGAVSENPDFEFPGNEAFIEQGGWVHSHGYIHKNGSTKPSSQEYLDSFSGKDELTFKIVQNEIEFDPPKGPLAEIKEDKPGTDEGGSKDWIIKQCGDPGVYKFGDATKSYVCTMVKSMRWPGAVTVTQGTKFANLYVGYGLKKCDHSKEDLVENKMQNKAFPFSSGSKSNPLESFWLSNPCQPADIMEEPVDHEEQPEPNPQEDDEASDRAEEDEPQDGED